MSITALQERLQRGQPVIADGSFGELARTRGLPTDLPLWVTSAFFDPHGQKVAQGIHEDYWRAGADIITTGTFRAQPRTFAAHQKATRSGHTMATPDALSRQAIQVAGQVAASSRNLATRGLRLVAGSMGPLEDSYTPSVTPSDKELAAEHERYAEFLAASGVDFAAIETIPTIREGVAAARAAQAAGLSYGVSFWGKTGGIGENETFWDASRAFENAGLAPLYIGVNCVGLEVADNALANLRNSTDLPIAVSANGDGDPTAHPEQTWQYGTGHDEVYTTAAQRWIAAGALIVGGCCGTTPGTIEGIAELVQAR